MTILLVVGASLELYHAPQEAATVPQTSVKTEDYSCGVSSPSTSGGETTVVLNSSDTVTYTLEVGPSPGLSIVPTSCSFYFYQRTAPAPCGTDCAPGVHEVETLGNNLGLNFSVASVGRGNLTLNVTAVGRNVPFGFLAGGGSPQVWLNSQRMAWVSSPPCNAGTPVQDNCVGLGDVSIIVSLPALAVGSQYRLLFNSTTSLVA